MFGRVNALSCYDGVGQTFAGKKISCTKNNFLLYQVQKYPVFLLLWFTVWAKVWTLPLMCGNQLIMSS